MLFRPVLTKADFSVRYRAGEFGNASPSWATLWEFQRSAPREGLFHLRCGSGPMGGGVTYYKQTAEQIEERWAAINNPDGWYCSQQIPLEVEETLLIQGEVQQTIYSGPGSPISPRFFYSTAPGPMRDSLRAGGREATGLMALGLLKTYLCVNSYDWLVELLDRYPGHAIELSTFAKRWGTLWPKFNTVFWEVRLY